MSEGLSFAVNAGLWLLARSQRDSKAVEDYRTPRRFANSSSNRVDGEGRCAGTAEGSGPWLGMPPAQKVGMNGAKQLAQGPRILIVEDDPVAARVYGQYLKKGGFHVMLATDGPTGLQKVRQLRPDGVLLDIMLPGLNGVEVLKEIRATNPDLPVVVYTNGFVPLLVDEVVAAGATHVFNKISLTSQELSNAFDKSLRRKAAA